MSVASQMQVEAVAYCFRFGLETRVALKRDTKLTGTVTECRMQQVFAGNRQLVFPVVLVRFDHNQAERYLEENELSAV